MKSVIKRTRKGKRWGLFDLRELEVIVVDEQGRVARDYGLPQDAGQRRIGLDSLNEP